MSFFRPVIFNDSDVVGGTYVSSSGGTAIKSGMFVVYHSPSTQHGASYGKPYFGPVLLASGIVSSATLYNIGSGVSNGTLTLKSWVQAFMNKGRIELIFKDSQDTEVTKYGDATISHLDDVLVFRGTEFALHKTYFGMGNAIATLTLGTLLYVGTSGKLICQTAASGRTMGRVAPIALVMATANGYVSCKYLK